MPRRARGGRPGEGGRRRGYSRNQSLAELTHYELVRALQQETRRLHSDIARARDRAERTEERRRNRVASRLLYNQTMSDLSNPVFESPTSIMHLHGSPTSIAQAEEEDFGTVALDFNGESDDDDDDYDYEELMNRMPRPLRRENDDNDFHDVI